jgi:hypothetical protein
MSTNSRTTSADEVFRLIEALAPAERELLFRLIEGRPNLSDSRAVVRIEIIVRCKNLLNLLYAFLKQSNWLLVEQANENWQRGKCSRVRRSKTIRRDEAIASALDVGIIEPDKILAHLMENYPELVRKGKKGGWIDPEPMMRRYRKRRGELTNCNLSD